ncbi:MAG: GNAT family N-acetyltransferase [Candidatus Rifleibacteriota bacterium]
MKLISVREYPEHRDRIIKYFQDKWASESSMKVYEDCITNCILSNNSLPQWYILEEGGNIVGGAGLITNDFISRMDLYPWLCAVYIEKEYRGNSYSKLLMDKARDDARKGGFDHVYLCTDHIGYYEKFGFEFIGIGYHPWGSESRIYKSKV